MQHSSRRSMRCFTQGLNTATSYLTKENLRKLAGRLPNLQDTSRQRPVSLNDSANISGGATGAETSSGGLVA